ncbi:methyltransferase domain-containing protein [Methanoregula sp.]|jgi:predicted SAM-dependent methyltransferase|uniref:class I SAM-dependent methyltransferase n=1 Tax=Methanoregula sp. TaxID=2052170 RepID=UPI0035698CBE
MRKLNLGCGSNWRKEGWDTLDHSILTKPWQLQPQAWNLPYADGVFDQVFTSHMFEHISSMKIEQTICEINRVMKNNGILRILTPDLKKLATAYVNNDAQTMQKFIDEDHSGISAKMGLGGAFINFISSAGSDNILLSSDYSEIIGSYAHVYCYDFEMLAYILQHYGFIIDQENSQIDHSNIQEHKELRNVPYNIDSGHSLVIECKKERYIPFDQESSLFCYGPYKRKELFPKKYRLTWLLFKLMGHVRRSLSRIGIS